MAEGRWEVGAQSGPFTEQERPRALRSHPAARTEPPGTRSCPAFVSEELYRGARRAGSRRSGGHENAGHGPSPPATAKARSPRAHWPVGGSGLNL